MIAKKKNALSTLCLMVQAELGLSFYVLHPVLFALHAINDLIDYCGRGLKSL